MLPGSKCGEESICYRDQCVLKSSLGPEVFETQIVNEYQNLKGYCEGSRDIDNLKSSNKDPHPPDECVNWESDFLCAASETCPTSNKEDTIALYTRHVCCEKCSSKRAVAKAFKGRARSVHTNISIIFMNIFICLIIFK